MTIVGYCGQVQVVPRWLDGANLTQTTARIAIDSTRASNSFCRYSLQSAVGKKQVAQYLKGAAQPGLNCGDVAEMLIALPKDRREQDHVALVLDGMQLECEALARQLAKARKLKDGLMQELLAGRIRLG